MCEISDEKLKEVVGGSKADEVWGNFLRYHCYRCANFNDKRYNRRCEHFDSLWEQFRKQAEETGKYQVVCRSYKPKS